MHNLSKVIDCLQKIFTVSHATYYIIYEKCTVTWQNFAVTKCENHRLKVQYGN